MAVVPGNRLHLHETLVHSGGRWFLPHTALLSPPTLILTPSRNTPTDIASNNHNKPVGPCCFFRNIQWLPCLSLISSYEKFWLQMCVLDSIATLHQSCDHKWADWPWPWFSKELKKVRIHNDKWTLSTWPEASTYSSTRKQNKTLLSYPTWVRNDCSLQSKYPSWCRNIRKLIEDKRNWKL